MATRIVNLPLSDYLDKTGQPSRAWRQFILGLVVGGVNLQTGTTYTYVALDRASLVSHSNANPIAATLPQAGGLFSSLWFVFVENRGGGTLTITPTVSLIDNATSLALTTNQGVMIFSDGVNYYTFRGAGSGGGGGGSVTSVSASGTRVTGTVTNPTTTPNIALALAATGVTPGIYTNASIIVQADGTLTAAASGSGGSGTVTSVTLTSTGGTVVITGTNPITTSGTINLESSGISQLTGDVTAGPGGGSQAATLQGVLTTLYGGI